MRKWLVPAGVGLLTVALSACGSLGTQLKTNTDVLDYNAAADASDATSQAKVTPVLVYGNLSGDGNAVCNSADVKGSSTATWIGVKVDPPVDGTYNGVKVTLTDNTYLAWEKTGSYNIAAVVMKGGPNTFVYRYDSPLTSDSGLRSPLNNGGNVPTISHYVLCFTEGTPPQEKTGLLKLRKIYDYVVPGNEMVDAFKGQYPLSGQMNGAYDYPEPIFGGWPIQVTQIEDGEGKAPATPYDATHSTLPEFQPDDGLYITVPVGLYKVTEYMPSATAGGGLWMSTGANKTEGGDTSSYGKGTTTVYVQVTENADRHQAPVARFFNVCVQPTVASSLAKAIIINPADYQVYEFPTDFIGDVTKATEWACLPEDWQLPEDVQPASR